MSTPVDLKSIEKEVFRRLFEDGLTELFLGIFLFFASILYLSGHHIPTILFGTLWVFITPTALEKTKKKLVYPRIGYAHPHQNKKEGIGIIISTIVVLGVYIASVILLGGVNNRQLFYHWITIPVGILVSMGFFSLYSKSGFKRYLFYIFYSLATGIGIALNPPAAKMAGIGLFCLILGIGFAIIGSVMLGRFIKIHPIQSDFNPEA